MMNKTNKTNKTKVHVLKHVAWRLAALLFLATTCGSAGAAQSQDSNAEKYPPGLIVTSVTKGSPAEQAGVKQNDLLMSLDGTLLRFDSQIPPICDKARWDGKKAVVLIIHRGGDNLTLNMMPADDPGIVSRPPLPPDAQRLYDEADALPKNQKAEILAKLQTAAKAAGNLGDNRAAVWFWLQVYRHTADGSQEEAEAQNAVLRFAELAGDELLAAGELTMLGAVAEGRGRLDDAAAYSRRAFEIRERLAPDSLDLAASVANLGVVAYHRGKLDEAEAYLKRSLAAFERFKYDSIDLALSLNILGLVASSRGKLDEAEGYHQRALAIRQRLAPNSVIVAGSLVNLGGVSYSRGKLDEADAYLKRALPAFEQSEPESLDLATDLNILGLVSRSRGKLDEAEAYLKHAKEIRDHLAPASLDVAASLVNLGVIAELRGKLDEAEAYFKQALTIHERLAPGSLDVALSLNNLGTIAISRGELNEAQSYNERALAIGERLAPDSVNVAESLTNLGAVAYGRGKLDDAEAFFKRALAEYERLQPDSLDFAGRLGNLGVVAEDRGKLDEAEAYFNRDLAITERLAPDSLDLAACLDNLGSVAEIRGKLDEAEERLQRAWKIVLRQGAQVAGDSARQAFGKANSLYAANLLTVQLMRRNQDSAFVTLEQGRAQALAEVMAERGITGKVAPPAVWHAYTVAVSAHNVAYKAAERAAVPVEKSKSLLNALKEQKADEATLIEKQRAVDEADKLYEPKRGEEIRSRSEMENRWEDVLLAVKAAIPPPIDPGQAKGHIAPGTLVAEFSTGKKYVLLFTVSTLGVNAYLLPASREELEAKVKFVRRYVARDADNRGPTLDNNSDIEQDALRTLFQKLFPPEVQKAIQQAKRVVISPDDFLWDLPFAALITSSIGPATYLGLQKPLSYTQSLSILVTRNPLGAGRGTGTLAIGNPVYDVGRRRDLEAAAHSAPEPQHSPTTQVKVASIRRDGELGMMTSDGAAPPQLPSAEQEARNVAKLYAAIPHIGVEPTEAWFRLHAPNAKVLHLATHGFLNAYSPESSGVLLAVPEKTPPVGQYDNDGTLQAWEVWSMKLKADLVVLSACETGRGTKVNGEGLIGLTRAFQYAGAKTIVSSQWKVNDQSTAALMTSFHKHLLAGADRDESLRLAMLEVAKSKTPGWSAPYHWAPFVMVGETGKMP